jgi:hypothetical protein
MGSILNFVFLSDKLEKNGDSNFITGPFFNYITNRCNFSYTLNSELKHGYKNLIFFEGAESLQSFYEHLDNSIIDFIKSNDVKLLAISLADPSSDFKYKKFVKKYKSLIDQNKIIIFDSNTSLKGAYTLDFFIEETINNRDVIFHGNQNELGYVSEEIQEEELNSVREKKFLCFNRGGDRLHRIRLLHEYLTNDFSDSYFSFLQKISDTTHIPNVEMNDYDFYNKHIPIELDTQMCNDKNSFRTSDTFKKELFLNSCINLVTETSFDLNELFISEKILKPILNYQPFIVFGPVNYLKKLKSYGFKTFSDFWDESYDDIINHEDRIESLVSLVHELNSKTIEELNELYQKTKEICIYNRNLFYNIDKMDSIGKYLKEIENEW